ncbi:unnamed protein product [Angiostrongylus costaricensis]|uniref:Uncharacterized protein n=1 Tax=Angiostrongylus costaricensis TaxID=334426 RepID=A0A0R3PLC8_ANGCS|nr:unnamed protein product [Angiostrongylus costaricensis]
MVNVHCLFSTDSRNGFDRCLRHLVGRPCIDSSFMQTTDGRNLESNKGTNCEKIAETSSISYSFLRASSFDRASESGVYSNNRAGTKFQKQWFLPSLSYDWNLGPNILCRVRREELARGGQPSVRLMAQAFEANDNCVTEKQGFFGVRKSRSVESARHINDGKTDAYVPCSLKHSSSQVKADEESLYATLPRGMRAFFITISDLTLFLNLGGRNPFKNMGSKLVEREKKSSSLKKTKKRSAEARARKTLGHD